jgi:ADP-ribosyltransferase exoenzyme
LNKSVSRKYIYFATTILALAMLVASTPAYSGLSAFKYSGGEVQKKNSKSKAQTNGNDEDKIYRELQCAAPGDSTASDASTAAVAECPDCDALKNSEYKDLLNLPKLFDLKTSVATAEDTKNIQPIIDRFVRGDSDTQEPIEAAKSMIQSYEGALFFTQLCLGNKKYTPAFAEIFLEYVDQATYNISPALNDAAEKLARLKTIRKSTNPNKSQIEFLCQEIFYWGNYDQSPDMYTWYQKRAKKTELEIADLEEILKQYQSRDKSATECGLTADERDLIKAYSGSFYRCINTALRGAGDDCLKSIKVGTEVIASAVKVMNSGLSKLKPYTESVYRGVGPLPAAVLAAHKEGAVIQFSSYLSTSTEIDAAFNQANLYIIKSKTGRIIAPIAFGQNEKEVLFAPMARFKITKIDMKSDDDPKNRNVYTLEEI